MWTEITVLLQFSKDGKPRHRYETLYSVKKTNEVPDGMVIAGLLKSNPAIEEYPITKVGAEALEYTRMKREGMMVVEA